MYVSSQYQLISLLSCLSALTQWAELPEVTTCTLFGTKNKQDAHDPHCSSQAAVQNFKQALAKLLLSQHFLSCLLVFHCLH